MSTHALLHGRYRLHAVHNERVICEDAIVMRGFDRRGHLGRPIATILLEGRARVDAHGRRAWMEPGDVLAMDAKKAIVMRQEGEPYLALAFEWEPSWIGPRPEPFTRARLDADRRGELAAIFDAVVRGDASSASVVRVVGALRAAGVELRTPSEDECSAEVPERTRLLSAALDRLFSRLDEQPMLADLERALGVSSRQLNRLVSAFNARYGFNADGWRDARNRRRLFVGVALMTAPDATAELVARAVGYRALAAFTHALKEAGLPAPSEIARVVASLRDVESE